MRIFITIITTCCLLFSFQTEAKALKKKQVPKAVRNAYKKQFPKMKATWVKDEKAFDAKFTQSKVVTMAQYDSTGQWVLTETEITAELVPEAVTKSLSQAEYSRWWIAKRGKAKSPMYEELYRITYQKGKAEIIALLLPNGNIVNKIQRDIVQ